MLWFIYNQFHYIYSSCWIIFIKFEKFSVSGFVTKQKTNDQNFLFIWNCEPLPGAMEEEASFHKNIEIFWNNIIR